MKAEGINAVMQSYAVFSYDCSEWRESRESSQLDPMEQVVNGTSSPLCADARRGQAPCGLYGGSGGCKSCPVALSVTQT